MWHLLLRCLPLLWLLENRSHDLLLSCQIVDKLDGRKGIRMVSLTGIQQRVDSVMGRLGWIQVEWQVKPLWTKLTTVRSSNGCLIVPTLDGWKGVRMVSLTGRSERRVDLLVYELWGVWHHLMLPACPGIHKVSTGARWRGPCRNTWRVCLRFVVCVDVRSGSFGLLKRKKKD